MASHVKPFVLVGDEGFPALNSGEEDVVFLEDVASLVTVVTAAAFTKSSLRAKPPTWMMCCLRRRKG